MMKHPAWFLVLAWAGAACGTSSSPDTGNAAEPPTGFTFETAEGTIASIGWTGVFHNIKGAPRTSFGVKVSRCDGGLCQFEGPVQPDAAVDPVEHRRCLFQTSKACAADADCPVAQGAPTPCVYVYDPPIATPLSGTSVKTGMSEVGACALTYIPLHAADGTPTIQGTLNLRSGELNLHQLTVLLVLNAVGDGAFQGVCPVCVGDPSPYDGKKDGTCQTSMVPDPKGRADPGRAGDVKCDVNRYGELPGYSYGYSMDCSPSLTPGVGTPTPFGGSFSSSGFKLSITDQSPKCGDPAFSSADCFCGMCSNSTAACMADAECGGGQCVGTSLPGAQAGPGNIPVAGNLCDGGVCNWNPAAGTGTCSSSRLGTPPPTVNCYPSATAGSKDSGGNPVGITAPGRAEVDDNVYYADTASARCTPAGTSPPVNAQVGLPGLTFQKRNFRIIPSYAENQK